MSDKNNLIKDLLAVAKKYNIKLFSIMQAPNGGIGVMDTIQDHQLYEDILTQLYDEFHAITFPDDPNTVSDEDTKGIPIEFLTGCMKATMSHLDNIQSNSEMDKYNQFSKGIVKGLSDDEINKFIDIKMKESIIPIQYFNFNELDECKGSGNVHLICCYLPVLCDICEYLKLTKFHIVSMPDDNKDLTVPNYVTSDDIKKFLHSNVRYNVFKLEIIDTELMRKICKDHPYPGK